MNRGYIIYWTPHKLKLKNSSIIGSVKLSGSGTESSSADHA